MTNDTNSKWNTFIAYNRADVLCAKRMEEIAYMYWLSELKQRWGIFWRIPFWWHRGRRPVSHATK